MNVLVYGVTGFIGKHLKARLIREGHTVIDGTRDYALIPDLVRDEPPIDALINCAGEITEPHKMYDANVALVEKLLVFAQRLGIPKFIQIGSSSEYGETTAPRCEGTPCVPTDLYSATKIAATALCEGFARQYDMDVVVARPFSLYGPGDTPRKLIPRLISSIRSKHTRVVDLHPGTHDFVFIDDFTEGLITLLYAPASKTKGDIVNFGTGIVTSNLGVASMIPGSQFTYKPEQQAGHLNSDNWVADITKARERFGWVAKTALEEGLRKTIKLS